MNIGMGITFPYRTLLVMGFVPNRLFLLSTSRIPRVNQPPLSNQSIR
jgi:hypothetical protein